MKSKKFEAWTLQNKEICARLERLGSPLTKQVREFLKTIGEAEVESESAKQLADTLIRAYEYRQFSDHIEEIEAVADDPDKLAELLGKLREWKALESGAIREIVEGRLNIVDKIRHMVAEGKPETASKLDTDNLHDLLADFPWLIDPEWQTLSEEKRITKQLREWHVADIPDPDDQQRYDFLALRGEGDLVVVEIKRPGHAVELDELQRLEGYRSKLSSSEKQMGPIVLVYDGVLNVDDHIERNWEQRPDARLVRWSEICDRAASYYEHYRAILRGEVEEDGFGKLQREQARAREVIAAGTSHRGTKLRKKGVGPSHVEYTEPALVKPAKKKTTPE